MTRILLVEDEPRTAHAIKVGLEDEGYVVDHVANGRNALVHAKLTTYDLLILDRRLPDLTGLQVLERLQERGTRVPCLMLTACDAASEIIEGLDAGADDYVAKPVRFAVLLARLRALHRRGGGSNGPVLSCGDLRFDPATRRVVRGERELELSTLELRLLEYLLRHVDAVQTRERIALAIWPDGREPSSNVLEVLVSHLRRKLEAGGELRLLHTRRAQGYLLSTRG
jgi:DNA-binding response OmpR family regulator